MKIAICTPHSGSLDIEHEDAVRKVRGAILVRVAGCSAVDQARALIAEGALQTDADVLFWIDSDIIFDPDDVQRLAELAVDYGIVGAAYAKKRPASGLVAAFLPETTGPVTFFEGGELMRVLGLGFGFVAIHRSVFEAMKKDFPPVLLMGKTVRGWFLPRIVDGV